jgi:prepilin-type N-terminal cleavage/methylation domain-containing protein
MRRVRAIGRGAAGFTLLEVLIAVSLLALVAGICYAAFHLGIRAVGKGEQVVVTAQRLRVATDVLIRQVKSAANHPALVDGDTYPFFYGTPTKMSLVTDAGQLAGGGRTLATYEVGSDARCAVLRASAPCLILQETPYFDSQDLGGDGASPVEPVSAAILDGFRSLTFQYLLDDGTESEWKTSWNYVENEILPMAVRVVVEGMPGLEEDLWGQEIPIMTAEFGEPEEWLEPQDCEGLETTGAGEEEDDDGTPGSRRSGAFGSRSFGSSGHGDADADEEDDE